jgi:hypothetical protein
LFKISDNKGSFAIAVIALIVVLIVVLAFAAVMFLPVKGVNFDESRSVSSAAGVKKLNLTLSTDVGEVRVIYTNLTGQALNLHVVAKGSVGYFMNANPISLDFVQGTSADTAIVSVIVSVKDRLLGSSNMNLRCDLMIDSSMRSKLNLATSFGSVMVNTTNASAIDQVSLSAKTGAVTLHVASGVSVYGDISLSTNIGLSVIDWNDAAVKQDIKVVASTEIGGVEFKVNQTTTMDRTVSLNGTAATGEVFLDLNIKGNVGAEINSSTDSKIGFIGSDRALTSTNYPDTGNFAIRLSTNAGGVEVKALCVPTNP